MDWGLDMVMLMAFRWGFRVGRCLLLGAWRVGGAAIEMGGVCVRLDCRARPFVALILHSRLAFSVVWVCGLSGDRGDVARIG